jgi:membrane protease YdiL (CAAX protease family)
MKAVRLSILIVLGLVVFGTTMTFAGKIGANDTVIVRAALMAVLGALWWVARREGPLKAWRPVLAAYFAIVAGLTVAFFAETPIMQALHLGFTPFSSAVDKAVQATLVSATIIVLMLASGASLGSLQLRKGRLLLGLGLGLAGFLIFVGLTFVPGGPGLKVASTAGGLGALMTLVPAVALFVFANAFMEELLFRGVLIERYEALTGKWGALFATTIVFAAVHVGVTYTAQLLFFLATVLVLGFLWGLLMQKSKSLWGSVLFHAGADVAVILPMYQAMISGH